MTSSLLATIGSRLAERSAGIVALRSAAFTLIAAVGIILGHRRPGDLDHLLDRVQVIADTIELSDPVSAALFAFALLLIAVAVEIVVRHLADVIERILMITPRGALSRWLTVRRVQRWAARNQGYRDAVVAAYRGEIGPEAAELKRDRRDRIALFEPRRPTWCGDRMVAIATRVEEAYGIDLAAVWPRIWITAPDPAVGEVRDASAAFRSSTALVAWGVAYAVVGCWWWPALVVAVGCLLLARAGMRTSLDAFATLIEATVDTRVRTVAMEIGLLGQDATPLDRETGRAMSARFRKAE